MVKDRRKKRSSERREKERELRDETLWLSKLKRNDRGYVPVKPDDLESSGGCFPEPTNNDRVNLITQSPVSYRSIEEEYEDGVYGVKADEEGKLVKDWGNI